MNSFLRLLTNIYILVFALISFFYHNYDYGWEITFFKELTLFSPSIIIIMWGFKSFSRWKKCKSKLSGLTNTDGHHRPGQAGTTGQLFFTKCGDPPEGCECKYEEPTGNE